jgi:disulfide bond formation protein DsbB
MTNAFALAWTLWELATRMPLAARLLLAANLGALAFAFTMQFGFGVAPCILCLWQRVPYGAAALVALFLVLASPRRRHVAALFRLAGGIYLIGCGLAFFHTGVERHWWAGTSGCKIQPLHGSSAEDLRQSLLQTVMPACDVISWNLFGLTLTNMNLAFSLAMAVFAFWAARRVNSRG